MPHKRLKCAFAMLNVCLLPIFVKSIARNHQQAKFFMLVFQSHSKQKEENYVNRFILPYI